MNAPGGTVREDYSPCGSLGIFPQDHTRSRVYRWNEDGLAGICDRHQLICFALALWALTIQPGETEVIRLRLAASEFRGENAFANFAKIFALRQREADEFYATLIPQDLSDDDQNLMRQVSLACCGPSSSTTMWSKTGRSVTPETHLRLRNAGRDVIASGRTSITPMSSRCPTNGNIHGTWMAMYTL